VDLESDAYVDGEENDIVSSERVREPEPTGTHSSAPAQEFLARLRLENAWKGKV
jgi:hypothetical protein